MSLGCQDQVVSQVTHPNKPLSHRVLKTYNVFNAAQNRIENQQDTRNSISLEFESLELSFFPILFPFTDFYERPNFLSLILRDSNCLL